MVDRRKPLEHHIAVEQKIISLMLKHYSAIDEMLENGFSAEFFDEPHQPLVNAIYQEYINSNRKRKLTRETYKQMLLDLGIKGDLQLDLSVWEKCFISYNVPIDDLGHLKKQLVESYIARQAHLCLDDFGKNIKTKGYFEAALELVDSLKIAVSLTQTGQTVFASLDELKDDYIKYIEDIRENPEKIITCGIPEIDDTINVGFKSQHMTLFVADVGGHKTNMMLNIALNIFDRGHSVLFIPLEMGRFDLINRITANRLNISFDKLAKPQLLSSEEMTKIKEAKIWDSHKYKFCILDAQERTSVSSLKHEIEKRAFTFKPKVVIIDYVANLKPDRTFGSRNDLEIGEILKSLRFLGKRYGFHTISAAQMGRAAIKALREGKDDAVDSTSIRGSHEYAADADTIFALMRVPNEEDKLKINTIKARHGRSGFTNELRVDAAHCLISSTSGTHRLTSQSDLEEELNTPSDVITDAVESMKPVAFNVNLNDLDDDDLDVAEIAGLDL